MILTCKYSFQKCQTAIILLSGLGRGLLIGYGFGLMTRPVGYRTRPVSSNTDAYKKPLHCTVANSTLYFTVCSCDLDMLSNRFMESFNNAISNIVSDIKINF